MMNLHTITGVKPYDNAGRLLLRFDDDDRPELTSLVDLSSVLAQGGVFEPLRDPQIFCSVEVGPRGRTLVWHVGEDVVDLCADALWMMSHHDAVGSPRRSPITADGIRKAIDQFARDIEDIASSYAREVDKMPPPPVIYHYTNDVGLRGILETGQFWFTNIFHLNDPSELKHGIQPAIDFLQAECRDDRPEIRQFANNVAAMLKQGIEDVAHYFVCCFSAAGDDLGQWRAYADSGRGYALGFDAHALEQVFAKANLSGSGHMTFPVNYDEAQLRDIHKRIVERALPLISLPRDREFPSGTIDDFMSELLQYLCLHVIRSALFFKHKAYANEQEYRFFQLFRFDATVPNIKYRARPYSLIKYREFDWRKVAPESLKKIVLGPAADPDKAFQFAADCLRHFHIGSVDISPSEVPYRAG